MFSHLHLHTEFSLLDGLGTPLQYVLKAKEIGQEYLGCTDHASVDSFLKFHTVAKENGIKPVLGTELYIVENASLSERGEDRHHVVVLVKNKTGFANVNKMLTIANTQHFYYKPRITPEILLAHSEGLVITTACISSFITRPWGVALLTRLHKKQPGDVYLEVMPHDIEKQKQLNQLCVGINESGIPLVATNDCHYIEDGDETAHDALLALQTGKTIRDKDRWRFSFSGLYMRSEGEMQQAFNDQGVIPKRLYTQAMENTIEIAEKCCGFTLEKQQVELPEVTIFPGMSDDETLKKLCTEALRRKKLSTTNTYRARLREELDIIIRQKLSRYFLIVYELISWCKKKDIMTGPGRGSSGGSLVCYLLGVTAVDPLKHGLLFARFINPARIDLPDIDMDFEDVRRPEIIDHIKEKYGEDNVAGVSSFVKMKSKLALRDASRVFNVPLKDVNTASATIIKRGWGDDIEEYDITRAFAEFPDGQKFKEKYSDAVQVALKMEFKVRSRGQHAAAVLISKDKLTNGERGYLLEREKGRVINWEKNDIEHFGLMKLDVLGLNALSILNGARKLIKQSKGIEIDYESIQLDDKKVLDEFTKGNCIGVFQFGSPGIRKVCMDLGIDSFETLVHANALYRPGTIYSGMVDEFIERRKGQPWSNLHPLLDKITGNTYGIFIYQEQVMLLLYELAGMRWETTDKVRKIIAKSKGQEEFLKYKAEFVKGCVSRGTLDEDSASDIYDELSSFGAYGFNKCLTGDTVVVRSGANEHQPKEITIGELFQIQDAQTSHGEKFRRQGVQVLQMDDDGRIRPGKLKAIYDNGLAEVYEIRTLSGKRIKATARHKFLTDQGYVRVSDLTYDHKLVIVGDREVYIKKKRQTERARGKNYEGRGMPSGEANPSYIDGRNIYFEKAKEKVLKRAGGCCENCGKPNGENERHEFAHLNSLDSFRGDFKKYHSQQNIRYFCNPCHKAYDYKLGVRKKRWSKGLPTKLDMITSMRSVGRMRTYDVEMETENHNFLANGIVSHNSHSVEYSMIAYWMMYLKVYFPLEFICASLTYCTEVKKEDLVTEAKRMKIDIRPPKVGISLAEEWVIKGNALYCPFIEIKGIGSVTSLKFMEVAKKKGFYEKPKKEGKTVAKYKQILQEIDAFVDVPLTDEQADRISPLFGFSFLRDSFLSYKHILGRLAKSKNFKLGITAEGDTVTFAKIVRLKFGGTAEAPQVMGDLVDQTTKYHRFVVDRELYRTKRDLVDHCADQFCLVQVTPDKNRIIINDMWSVEEVKACEFMDAKLDVIRRKRFTKSDELARCNNCELRKECKAPVYPSTGRYNVMIIGEAPGRNEDKVGSGFVGRAGDVCWNSLERHALYRDMFHVTNVCKCFPAQTRTPKNKHIKACREWIEKEIEAVQPVLVLAFGNTCLNFFSGRESGISEMSGKIEWLEKYKMWVCWCIHPASVVYTPENQSTFDEAIDKFAEAIDTLSGEYMVQ